MFRLENEFDKNFHFKYRTPFFDSRYYKIEIERIKSHLSRSSKAESVYFLWLLEFYIFHVEYLFFALARKGDFNQAKQHLCAANKYACIIIEYGSQACNCIQGSRPFIISNKASFMMVLLLLSDNENFNNIGKCLIDSLNGKNCIIKRSYSKATISWFSLKLYSLYSDQAITLHPLLQPKLKTPYTTILENWNTTDTNEVSKYIDLLCDAHLAQAHLDHAQTQGEEVGSLEYKELFIPGCYIFPFEALFWLKLRLLYGLNNPTNFNHSLMNNEVTKFFMNLDGPLPDPGKLPHVKELMDNLRKQCPDLDYNN